MSHEFRDLINTGKKDKIIPIKKHNSKHSEPMGEIKVGSSHEPIKEGFIFLCNIVATALITVIFLWPNYRNESILLLIILALSWIIFQLWNELSYRKKYR
jgi:hypothetical protein